MARTETVVDNPSNFFFLTSRPYPLHDISTSISAAWVTRGASYLSPPDNATTQMAVLSGVLDLALHEYDYGMDEASTEIDILEGTLKSIVLKYDHPLEDNNINQMSILSGTLDEVVIKYDNYPLENTTSTITILSGALG